ncbi:hypothetical protein K0U27_07675, partial [archaeon]|nr:hypothetical protein [archaeon]
MSIHIQKSRAKELLCGRSSLSVMCAIVYMACRIEDTSRTLNNIADTAGIKKKAIQHVYRTLFTNLDGANS